MDNLKKSQTLPPLVEILAQHVSFVDDELKKKDLASLIGPWRGDVKLKEHLSLFKTSACALSDSCTKLTVLSNSNPSQEILKSIGQEVVDKSNNLIAGYLLVTNQQLSKPLFVCLTRTCRTYLGTIHDLLSLVNSNSFDYINSATGMVWKAAEDIKNLPINNRNAYRRAVLEVVGILKDTVNEFQDYLTKAKSQQEKLGDGLESLSLRAHEGGSDEGSEDEDDDEDSLNLDEMAEEPYNEQEQRILEQCIRLFEFSYGTVKDALDTVTTLADDLDPPLHPLPSPTSPDTPPLPPLSDCVISCRQWVAIVLRDVESINNCTIDLGGELYAPIDIPKTLGAHQVCVTAVGALIRDLKSIQDAPGVKSSIGVTQSQLLSALLQTQLSLDNMSTLELL